MMLSDVGLCFHKDGITDAGNGLLGKILPDGRKHA
jgi:hypothetical protein